MSSPSSPLPSLPDQARRLIALGLPDLAGVTEASIHRAASEGPPDALLVLRQDLLPASRLAPLLRHAGRPGFVVSDMVDVDRFAPIGVARPPWSWGRIAATSSPTGRRSRRSPP